MHEQWTKKYYGNHCTVQFCTVQFCFAIKHVMALFWNQANRYACLGISECKMFVWSHAPVTFVDVLWSLFHLLTGTSVRMEHATASSASSDAVEIRLQRHCEMMQDGVAELLSFLLPSFVKLVFPEWIVQLCSDKHARERLRRVLRKKAAVILHLHIFTSADLDLHTFTSADLLHPHTCRSRSSHLLQI